ncbi:MAG TPA: ABC transporter ATP-binding protein [Candidatus Binatia bacterium]|nr:ABC transporter ATP-binding protein [Candidatus Binatia bacterium]
MATTKPTTLLRLRRLTPFISPFLRRLILIFLLSLFGTVLGLLWPLFTKILIDDVLLAKNLHLLFVLSGVMVAATALGYGVGALNRYHYTQVTARILFALRQHLFAHLQALALRFHTRAKVGDLLSRLNTDISEVQSVLTDAAFAFVTNVFVLLATVGFLVWLNWRLFLVSLLVVPVQLYAVSKVRPLVVEETRKVRELNAAIASFLVESLSAIKFIKLFTAEGIQLGKLGIFGERFVGAVTRFEMLNYLASTASTATTFVGGALTTLYGGYLVMQGEMTIGGLIAFSTYQSRAFSPLQALLDLYLRIERAGVSLDRIFEFLDLGKEHEERSGALRLPDLRGEVEFREVTFAYEAGEPVLRQVSFHVPAGERLTLLGPSGTGKTTVADLLVRLYEPGGGVILLDGHDIRQYDLSWLRRQIVVVSHEAVLFHASLAENLRYASPEAPWEEVTAAAAAAGLHEFIASLPQGYHTLVGERGARLSAGQKQRVALARAVLKKPKILVLDEALSGLDVASEAEVRRALEALMAGRTTLVITHRLSSLRGDDAVVVLDAGRVVWRGRYGDAANSPGELRARLREWESRAGEEGPGSGVRGPASDVRGVELAAPRR